MKIYILKENLKRALQSIDRITPKSMSLPILGNVLLKTEKNILCLSATDLEMAINYRVLAKNDKDGQVVVPAKLLCNLLNSIPGEKIELEDKNNILIIKGDNFNTHINSCKLDDFPLIPELKETSVFKIENSLLCAGLNQIINTTSVSNNKPELTGVYFKIHHEGIVLASTDSFRLSEKHLFFDKNENNVQREEYSFIVPSKAVKELISLFSNEEGQLNIHLAPNQIAFEYDNKAPQLKVQLISRLIEGDFPSYQDIIPGKYDTQATINKNKLISNLRAASILSPKTNEISLTVKPSDGELSFFSQNPESGEYSATMQCKCEGDEVKADFNWRFLMDGLNNINGEEVILGLQKNDKPAALKPVSDATYLYVVMPIRSV